MTLDYEDIDPFVCMRCGVRDRKGPHAAVSDCISALRAIAGRLMRKKGLGEPKTATEPTDECIDALRAEIACAQMYQSPRGVPKRGTTRGISFIARAVRRDAHIVVLDGERIYLTEAARRLNISPAALHFRLVARTGTKHYTGVDIRAVRADVPYSRAEASRAAHAAKARLRGLAYVLPSTRQGFSIAV